MAEQRVSGAEDRLIKSISSNRDFLNWKKNEQSLVDLWNNNIMSNIQVIRIPGDVYSYKNVGRDNVREPFKSGKRHKPQLKKLSKPSAG